nr:putative reverse transcriptase domain-containing protein [Tanacetum cinerariifolium]
MGLYHGLTMYLWLDQLSRIHSTFYVSNLKKFLSDESLVIPLNEIQTDDKLHFIEEPIEIMDREVKCLKQSRIPIVKVCWNSKRGPEFTWECEDQMQKKSRLGHIDFRTSSVGYIFAHRYVRKDKSGPSTESWSSASLSEKTTQVSLVPGVIPRPSSSVRGMVAPSYCTPFSGGEPTWETRSPKSRVGYARTVLTMNQRLLGSPWLIGCVGLSRGFDILIPFYDVSAPGEESDDLNLPDAEAVDSALEASSLPKFDMHMYKSSLLETNVKWLTKCYGILADLHPRVVPEDMTMDALPNDAIGLYAHHFQQGGVGKNCKPCFKDAPTSLKKWKDKFFLVDRTAAPIAMAWRHHDFSVADPFPKPSVAKLREVVIVLRKPPP